MRREKQGLGLGLLGLVCPTEEEKAEAREFEEDQVAGRLKEDVVCEAGGWWEEGVGLARPLGPHPSPLSAA